MNRSHRRTARIERSIKESGGFTYAHTKVWARGFTLTEMLVSVSIMTLISTFVFFNFPKFNQEVLMNRAARELASAFREAQARAVGIVAFPGLVPPNQFPDNYAVYVTEVAPNNNRFIIFSDLDGDRKYDVGEAVPQKTFQFSQGVRVVELKSPHGGGAFPTALHILSYRPGPTTIVTGPAGVVHNGIGPFEIHIRSADNSITKTVCVWLTGQVSIKSGAGC